MNATEGKVDQMLAMTDAAAQAISALTEQQGEDKGGLRFAVQAEQEEGAQLSLAVAGEPQDGDQVLGTEEGARVFLEPQAAAFLDDKVLDVQQDQEGSLAFAVVPQSEVLPQQEEGTAGTA